jgi:hypothetical protein
MFIYSFTYKSLNNSGIQEKGSNDSF